MGTLFVSLNGRQEAELISLTYVYLLCIQTQLTTVQVWVVSSRQPLIYITCAVLYTSSVLFGCKLHRVVFEIRDSFGHAGQVKHQIQLLD